MRPDIAIITSVAPEHMEFFKTIDAVAREELSISQAAKKTIFNLHDIDKKVSRIEQFGIFVNVESGVDGLIHNSKLESDQQLKKGDKISVNIESIDQENKRMSLTLVTNQLPVDYK